MKSLLKFTLLSILIISGRLAKESASVTVAHTTKSVVKPGSPAILVHQVLTSEPVRPARQPTPPQSSGNGLIAEMF